MLKDGATRTSSQAGTPYADGAGRVLACLGCQRAITTTAARIEMGGAHVHSFDNPDGVRFRIGCFADASGLLRVGTPSLEWTWFAGFSWQAEVCAGCRAHLGWLYRAGADRFHGLILDALLEIDAAEH